MRSRLVPAGIISALAVVAGAGSFFAWHSPTWSSHSWVLSNSETVRVATVPVNDVGRKFFSALKREIASERARVQLSLMETPSIWASAQALKEQKVDAAVVRSDDPASADGRTIFVLRNVYAALLVPASASIDNIAKLKGKKIGVLTEDPGIDPMAKVVLDFYGFDEKHRVHLSPKDLSAALQRRQVAAVLAVGPTGTGALAEAIEAFRQATKKPPKFLDLAEAKAIGERYAPYDEAEISVGAFSGSPPVPAEKVTTISANVLLVAQASLSNSAAGEMTRLLLATKTRVAATLPDAGQLAAPSTDKDELLPAHPGTVAFLNGEQSNALDESINWILLASMLTGFAGSLAAWLNRLRNKRKADEVKGRLRRLRVLQVQASSMAGDKIDATEKELDAISQWVRQKFGANELALEDFQDAEARAGDIAALIEVRRASLSLDGEIDEASEPSPVRLVDVEEKPDPRRLPGRGRLVAVKTIARPPVDAA
jgi:TRAP transporter TAXI family solute receptor